ncbi:Protein of unknown function [Cotesia congregata]|uniref:Uncharacterized protein n=1 Tax=Cotesia congregata TaxID=51543 RepID=A0A8J2MSR4_COTCN|nr:Protein of unknown function [Cotesia congregata]
MKIEAIEKNWKMHGLTPLSKSSFKARCLKKLIMALPLASPEDIPTLFLIIVLLIPPPMFLKLNDFMAYVFKQWLAIIGPENLSVAGKDSLRTNNPSESINKSINKLLGLKKKLSPIFFTRALIQFQIKSQTRVISMLKMKNVHFEKKLSSTERIRNC